MVVNLVSICNAYVLAAWIRGGILQPDFLETKYGITNIIIVLSYIVIYEISNSRHSLFKRGFYAEFVAVLKEQSKLYLIVMTYLFVTKQGVEHSRVFLMIFVLLNFTITYVTRDSA